MLEKHATGFLTYCTTASFSRKSIDSLTSTLKSLDSYFDSRPVDSHQAITYRQLADFIAFFISYSIHKKKARVWCLHQFFHYLVTTKQIKENIALGLPYPKIERTVPLFLTASEFNRIIEHFCRRTETVLWTSEI